MTKHSWRKSRIVQYASNVIGVCRVLPKRIATQCKSFGGTKRFIPISISLFLVLVSLGTVTYVLLPKGKLGGEYYESIEGLSILFDCDTSSSIEVQLQPVFGMRTVMVAIFIEDWADMREDCEVIQVNFPGSTCCHKYKVPFVLEPPITEMDFVTGRYLRYPEIEIIREPEPETKRDVILIFPNEIEDFSGLITFFWVDGVVRTAFAEYALVIPFLSTGGLIEDMSRAEDYTFILWTPKSYSIVSSVPEPLRMRMFGRMCYYIFEIGPLGIGSDLVIYFEDGKLGKIENYVIIISSTVMGVALALLVQQITHFVMGKKASE